MKQSVTQRIQVGLVGLFVVLLFVSLANMALDQVNEQPAPNASQTAMPTDITSEPKEPAAGEPLAELGVTPVAKEEPKLQDAPDAGSANMQAAPAKPQ